MVLFLAGCVKSFEGKLDSSFDDINVNDIYESFDKAFRYVHYNFYYSTPHHDLDPDYEQLDENYGCKSKNYKSLKEFKDHMINDYNLTDDFAQRLIDRYYPNYLYEKEDSLYVVIADRGSNTSVGERISKELIRESDNKIILRSTYESIDINTGKVDGSFDVDSILIHIDDKWLWDEIPKVY